MAVTQYNGDASDGIVRRSETVFGGPPTPTIP